MTVLANKFIPMSLVDIANSINDIHDDLAAIRALVEGSDSSALAEELSVVQDKVDSLQTSFNEFEENSDPSLAATVQDISSRVSDLEDVSNNFFGA